MNVLQFKERKHSGKKISMVTCYDYTSARIISESNVDSILVGDSAAMTMHGHTSTLPANITMMAYHVSAVVRGAPEKWIVADLPFLSYRKSISDNMSAVETLMKAGAHAVKLEGVDGNEEFIHHLVQSGVPVMGHLGLTPQFFHSLGGFRVQGREEKSAHLIQQQALTLQKAGVFSVVLECVPSALARTITETLEIPTIGIGAGPDTDGQVLVWQDLLGMNLDFKPKFVRQFIDGQKMILNALNQFHEEVEKKTFPSISESFEK